MRGGRGQNPPGNRSAPERITPEAGSSGATGDHHHPLDRDRRSSYDRSRYGDWYITGDTRVPSAGRNGLLGAGLRTPTNVDTGRSHTTTRRHTPREEDTRGARRRVWVGAGRDGLRVGGWGRILTYEHASVVTSHPESQVHRGGPHAGRAGHKVAQRSAGEGHFDRFSGPRIYPIHSSTPCEPIKTRFPGKVPGGTLVTREFTEHPRSITLHADHVLGRFSPEI